LPVLAQIRQQIEVRIACLNLETDSRRAVAFANQDAMAQHTVDQVCRCAVEHDEIDVATDCCFQIGGEVDTQPAWRHDQGNGREFTREQYRWPQQSRSSVWSGAQMDWLHRLSHDIHALILGRAQTAIAAF
jgi:ribosome-binding protein aMBF1 (putative translation factor)